MFEAHVLHLLRKYLGEYVHGLSVEALKISVWKGDVVLKDLKLKAEALNSLKLPLTVKAGFVGSITLKVPWKSLGKEPVVVIIDRVFLLARPTSVGSILPEDDRDRLFQAKIHGIEEAESATLEAISKTKQAKSWLGSLVATIIGNLKISITTVHIRYEDFSSHHGNPFCVGLTLAKLAAVTTDEHGNETFDTSGVLDKLHKALQLERLALYHDSNRLPWKLDKKWEDLGPDEWVDIFESGIREFEDDCTLNHNYLVSPINGSLKYHRLGNQERHDPEVPFEKATLVLSDVSFTITEAQYHDWIKLVEVISRHKRFIDVSHLRPVMSVSKDPCSWWRYASQASLQQRKTCYRLSWDQTQRLCQLRRRYIQLYASSLQFLSDIDYSEMRVIEKDLDSKIILLWRLLAHAKVKSARSKGRVEKKRTKKRWSWFGWHASSEDFCGDDDSNRPKEEKFTKEEWQAIDSILSYHHNEELRSHFQKDAHNAVLYLFNVSITQSAARIVDRNQIEIICGRFEHLHVSSKIKKHGTFCDVSLRYYGLSAPEGSIAESVCSKNKVNALAANFSYLPVGENVDWTLSAAISPCHVTIFIESYDRFLEFLKRSNAVSPVVVSETTTSLQLKIGKASRKAQEQFKMVFEEQNRFALHVDLDAPKIRIPVRNRMSSNCECHFVFDFGHFTLFTKGSHLDEQVPNIYSRFYIYGRDIAAFFTDCSSTGKNCTLVGEDYDDTSVMNGSMDGDSFCSVVDKCGVGVVVDRIKVPHPSYPSTCISIQVPNLRVHFSPTRYHWIIKLVDMAYCAMDDSIQHNLKNLQNDASSCDAAGLATEARMLVWRGIGNSVASWYPCFVVLSGIHVYVLESQKSQSYQRRFSLAGKQVCEILPADIGGSHFCLALGLRGKDIHEIVESCSALVIKFLNENDKSIWSKALIQATYQASAPPAVDVLGDPCDDLLDIDDHKISNSRAADLVVNGALREARLLLYGKADNLVHENLDEVLILELFASGAKVNILYLDNDLTIKMKLHSLQIKDELLCAQFNTSKYLARSPLSGEAFGGPLNGSDIHNEPLSLVTEDDDIFTDALPDFSYLSDRVDVVQSMMEEDGLSCGGFVSPESIFPENDFIKKSRVPSELFYEANGPEGSDFVSLNFSSRSASSPHYVGVDTEMNIHMSKLEFFCNRPTIVALMRFGWDISSRVSGIDVQNASEDTTLVNEELKGKDKYLVHGLLGSGKGRIIFLLKLNFDSVTVFLNMEDDSQLAMLVQDCFCLNLKVHPSGISIDGALGNFRLSDLSLGQNPRWGLLCDMRNPDVDSIIKFTFNSYSIGNDDYNGYDYSLQGCLSAVRIVFLYRFVQEVMAYFMELATPHSEEAIKLIDKVGDFEWWIKKYEIDGLSALKLDLSLVTPLIIFPRDSLSNDFVQLDIEKLIITNDISWYGGCKDDPSAVLLDLLHAEIHGVNMAVGVNNILGESMIKECQGIDIFVQRSLRDIFRRVPIFSLELKIGSLHGRLTDKEYYVILDCAYMNLYEVPRLPASFRRNESGSKDAIRLLIDKVNTSSQNFLSRNVTILAVEVDHALLELCVCIQKELLPLAHLSVESLWISYRVTSFSETDAYVTLRKFSIFDLRRSTRPEMRLMLGLSTDASMQSCGANFPSSLGRNQFMRINSEFSTAVDVSYPTMFLMDFRSRTSSQSYVVRVQQPRVLVVPDFLIAVGEFFIPTLGTITGRKEATDPKNDPILKSNFIVLSESYYKQKEEVVYLSPCRQLVVDSSGVDEYIYDGCGGTICLSVNADVKGSHRFQHIIFIGRGKRLRFVNVKFKNGSLLGKYTYLSNDSSYTVSSDDGVDMLSDHHSPHGNAGSIHDVEDSPAVLTASCGQLAQTKLANFTFEAQLVCPEFVFYDSSVNFVDNISNDEKFLCAKVGLIFISAKKESDIWIRALMQNATIEAGSGLVILDPIDVSVGYSSVKDKTSISLFSTDLCARLSFGVISLALTFQNQVAAALRFGDVDPIIQCTNFEHVWGSSKGIGTCSNLTFWRPRAPPNYVVLGDCVTSRAAPPSQAVMAVSQMYGRVCQPLGFKLICSLSEIQNLELDDTQYDCSLWMPIAPSGYSAVGCVAHVGSAPPLNHVAYCLRSDLLTSSPYSDCICTFASSPLFSSGFSIWRSDNIVGSFFAHPSIECPRNGKNFELNYLLLWSSIGIRSPPSHPSIGHDYGNENADSQIEKSSQCDPSRSVPRGTHYYMSTPHFERIWWDKGSDARRELSIWRPIHCSGYAVLGDCVAEGPEPPPLGVLFKADNHEIAAMPVQFTRVAHISGKGIEEAFFWYPIAPPGYASLGCLVTRTDEAPDLGLLCCPRLDLVTSACIEEVPIAIPLGLKSSTNWSMWKVENQACTFLVRSDLKKPSTRLCYKFGEYFESKAQKSIAAEFKLRLLSLTILDSLWGVVTPLVDATITDIKFAAHGEIEKMNTVIVASIAASSFNTQLEAWEPLVEPFHGIFKFEIYGVGGSESPGFCRRVRISVTDVLNLNVSAANLDMFVQAINSWKTHSKVEGKTTNVNDQSVLRRNGDSLVFSALDEDNIRAVFVQNKLGCDLYLKKGEHMSETVELISEGNCVSVWVPPPRFSDRLNIAGDTIEARYFAAVCIYEAQGLPLVDGGSGHNFFCALRLTIDGKVVDQQWTPQSARTRCVKPSNFDNDNQNGPVVRWNELFIFEVPHKSSAKLEVEVTNLAAKAGKGEVVGEFAYSVGCAHNHLKRVPSKKMLLQSCDPQNMFSYQLKQRREHVNDDGHGKMCVLVSTTYFQWKTSSQKGVGLKDNGEADVAFWVGLNPKDANECVSSLLPLSVVPRIFCGNALAMEVKVRNGRKHAIFRSLATVANDSDVSVDILIGPMSIVNNIFEASDLNIVVEEIFENQRYHPSSGWGCGIDANGSQSWSSRDFTFSSEDFFEPPLEPGWRWTTSWSIDHSAFVDSEGWAYGYDFKEIFWHPMSWDSRVNSSVNVVRRRRWIRTRQQNNGTLNHLNDILYLSPGSSAVLPWRSMFGDSTHCMLLRPHLDLPEAHYCWSQVVTVGYGSDIASEQVLGDQASLLKESNWKHEKRKAATQWFQLNQLEEKDVLSRCSPRIENRQMWFTMAVDASILHTELNTPVYDWKVSINSPLKLDNRLPCTVEFTIWEKNLEGTIAGRHHGVVHSRESVCIYSADIRKPVYMSIFIGGGWALEKDPMLIMDISSKEYVSSFAVIQKQTKRRLFVNVGRDMGGTNAAPKVVRLFVPYWIVNETFLPLVYHIIETGSSENTGLDSPSVSRAIKSRTAIRNPTFIASRGRSFSRRSIEVLDVIEDTDTAVSMLSLQDYMSHTVSMSPSRTRASISSNIGISVAICPSENFSDAVSLLELEKKELTVIKIFISPGSYYKLSLSMNMTSDRTKVVHIQPHTLFVNRIGRSICLQQSGTHSEEWIHPTDCPRPFSWQSLGNAELLRLRVDGFNWSEPFTVENEGLTSVHLKGIGACDSLWLRVEVRHGMKSSHYEVIFMLNLLSCPYRIENRTLSLPLQYRQVDSDLWHSLDPNSAVSFLWKDLGKPRLLELVPYGCDSSISWKCKIDEVSDCPIFSDGPTGAIRVTVVKEETVNIIKISDLYPDMEYPASSKRLQSLGFDSQVQQPFVPCSEVHIILELSELGLSIIDHTPEEILYLSMENFVLSYSSGLASGVSRLELRVHKIQVDNQLPLTPMPVLFRPQRIGGETDTILKFTMTLQSNGSFDLSVYPYIGVHVPENSALLINIHEPIIWRLHEMIQKVDIKDLYVTQTTEVPVDPVIHVGVLNISEVRFKLSMSMSPTQRPKGVLGFWASLMTALGNTENMLVKINHKFRENIHLRRSVLFSSAMSNIKKDLLSQPLQLLSGVDILGNASSALGHMSRGVAALSMDKKFIQGRQRQENKGVEDFGDVIREGGGALAKGLFRGVTGILTKPLEGAKASGVEGFVQGVGKGIIGAAAQPVSGVLDLLSRTTEGANAMKVKILSALTSEEQLLRKRLPRVIGGDNLLRLYDEYKAQGQVILQLAESASFFGQVDLFKVRGKFALSDAYEDHFLLPKGKILVITHRRVILLQQPINTIGLRKFSPARDPCSVLWDVSWDKLAAMELVLVEDRPTAHPSRLIIYLQTRSADIKERARVVKCVEESDQASEVYSSISQTMNMYGPCHSQVVAGKLRSKKSMSKN